MDKTAVVIVVAIVIVAAIFLVWHFAVPKTAVTPTALPPGIVLFYGEQCPHCQDVEKFIVANNIDQKVKYTKLEVPFEFKTSTQLVANAELAVQLAKDCQLDASQGVSIPFLYNPDGTGAGKCLIGETDVINFYKNAAGIK